MRCQSLIEGWAVRTLSATFAYCAGSPVQRTAKTGSKFWKLFSRRGAVVELAAEPGLRDPQFGTDLGQGEAEDVGGLLRGHSAEEAHFDELGLERVVGLEGLEGVVDADDHGISLDGRVHELVEGEDDLSGAALGGVAGAGVVGKNLAHDVGRDAEKMGTALEVGLAGIDKAEVGFVDEGGGLEGVSDTLLAEVVSGEFAQFGVDLRQEAVEGGLVAPCQVL